MTRSRSVDASWWDAAFARQGHTGWADRQVYRYDQPIRLASVRRALAGKYGAGVNRIQAIDAGCGTGDFALTLAEFGATVVAFDFSAAVLEVARGRFAKAGQDIQALQASATKIPAEDSSADVVTSITVLQHLVDAADLHAALGEFRRVLRPGGMLILLELAPPIMQVNRSPDGHVTERPVAVWQAAFEHAGLKIEREITYPQWGISILRGFAKAIDGIRAEAIIAPPVPHDSVSAATPSLARNVLRNGLIVARTVLLALTWPLDHLLRLPSPSAHRYYRLWILRTC